MESTSKCAVCFIPTGSFRYEALACSSCAMFFRRQVMSTKLLICKSAGFLGNRDCYETNNCRLCRLRLCFATGMSADAIHLNNDSREYSKQTRNKIQFEIREEEEDDKQIVSVNPSVPEPVIDRVISNLRKVEDAFNRIRFSKFNPLTTSVNLLEEALSGFSKLSIEYEPMEGWPLENPKAYTTIDGSFEETVKKRIISGLDTEQFMGNRKAWYFCNVIFAIEYFKTMDVFNKLQSNTKRVLAGKMALMSVNLSTYYFSMKYHKHEQKDEIIHPDGTGPYEGMETQQYEAAVACIQSLRNLNLDENEYVLMKVLLILSPSLEDASSSERAILTNQSENYAKILFSYVMAIRGREHGPRKYQEMLAMINAINNRTKMERDLQVLMGALGLYRHYECPLLEEIMLI